ncbi:unnamed protein product, partial [marine sediment metagenome]
PLDNTGRGESIDECLNEPGWSTPEKAVEMYFESLFNGNFDHLVKAVLNSDNDHTGPKFALAKTPAMREMQGKDFEEEAKALSARGTLHKVEIKGVEIKKEGRLRVHTGMNLKYELSSSFAVLNHHAAQATS